MKATPQAILHFLTDHPTTTATQLASHFSVSKQYVSRLLQPLVAQGLVEKIGSTRGAFFQLSNTSRQFPIGEYVFRQKYSLKGLEEYSVWEEIEKQGLVKDIPRAVYEKTQYAFTEMLNNAIDHSEAKSVVVTFSRIKQTLTFQIKDSGIGIFQSIKEKKHLSSIDEAIEEVMKGKLTTQPTKHSGEGVFFTSKVVDFFQIESGEKRLTISQDVFLESMQKTVGTTVLCRVDLHSEKQLTTIFRRYTNESFGFDKTEIHVKLYTFRTTFISRSEAKRLLKNLEKFQRIILDFKNVTLIGQGFADEIFRVWKNNHTQKELEYIHANPDVEFMILRSLSPRNLKNQ